MASSIGPIDSIRAQRLVKILSIKEFTYCQDDVYTSPTFETSILTYNITGLRLDRGVFAITRDGK